MFLTVSALTMLLVNQAPVPVATGSISNASSLLYGMPFTFVQPQGTCELSLNTLFMEVNCDSGNYDINGDFVTNINFPSGQATTVSGGHGKYNWFGLNFIKPANLNSVVVRGTLKASATIPPFPVQLIKVSLKSVP